MDSLEAKYHRLYDLAPVMIISIDPLTGEIVECNQQFLRSLGYDREEVIGASVRDFLAEGSFKLSDQTMERLANGDDLVEQELQVLGKDQAIIEVQQRIVAIRDEQGCISYASCAWLDITQRKQAERELSESRHQLQSILDHTSAVIYAKDLDGKYLLINRRFEELFDVTLDRIRGQTDFEIFPEAIARVFRENDRKVLQRNRPTMFEELANHQDDLRTYISVKFPLCNKRGKAYAICGISTDITLRKRVEAALHESEQRFRQLADNVPDCFWVTEVGTWTSLYVSAAFERIWGRSRASLYQDSSLWFQAIHESDRARVQRAFTQSVTLGDYNEEYRVVRPDGTIRWVHDHGVPIRDQDDQVFRVVGIAQDITERKALQKQVSDVSAREQQRIGHEIHDELGQQLTGLSFLAKSLQRRLTDQGLPEARDAAAIAEGIQSSIGEVRRIVRGLAPVDLDEHGLMIALERLAENTSQRSQIDCRFASAFEVGIPDHTVATHLYRIAQEAVNNAVKHSRADRIDVSLIGHEGMILLRVHDNGIGIGTDSKSEGSMGLEIMRHRAGIINANLELTSSSQFGTEIACIVRKETNQEH